MRARDDRGVTLIELLVVITVMSIVVPVIVASIVVGLQTAEGTADRVNLSHDAKISGVYLVPDIQSAQTVTLGSSTCTNAVGTQIISFSWNYEGVTVLTSYVENPTTRDLVRTVCNDGVQDQDLTVTVAHNLSDQAVTATCAPSCAATEREVQVNIELCGRLPSGPNAGTCRADTTHAFAVQARSRTQV